MLISIIYIIPAFFCVGFVVFGQETNMGIGGFILLTIVFWCIVRFIHRTVPLVQFLLHFFVHSLFVAGFAALNLYAVLNYFFFWVITDLLSLEAAAAQQEMMWQFGIIAVADIAYIGAIICFYQWKKKKA